MDYDDEPRRYDMEIHHRDEALNRRAVRSLTPTDGVEVRSWFATRKLARMEKVYRQLEKTLVAATAAGSAYLDNQEVADEIRHLPYTLQRRREHREKVERLRNTVEIMKVELQKKRLETELYGAGGEGTSRERKKRRRPTPAEKVVEQKHTLDDELAILRSAGFTEEDPEWQKVVAAYQNRVQNM